MDREGPVVFSTAVEGFGRSFRAKMSSALLAEAKSLGVDFDHLLPAYPLQTWESLMQKVGDTLYRDVPPELRFRRMGRDFLNGYLETLLGKAILATAKLLGPRRTLERMARNFQTGTNYVAFETRALGDNHVEIATWMHEQFLDEWRGRPTVMLDYRHGILEQLLTTLGANGELVRTELDLQRQFARYDARWD